MPDWLPLGTHQYRVEEDIYVLKGCGELTLSDTQLLLATCHELGDKYGHWLVLVDARAGVRMSAAARRHVGDSNRGRSDRETVTAIFGGGLIERTVILFIKNALKLVRTAEMPIEMFKTESEARQWLNEQREYLRQAKRDAAPQRK